MAIDVIEVPDKVAQVAYRRCSEMMRWWAVGGTYDLTRLVISAYLQGVEDGITAKERQLERGKDVKE